MTTDVTLADIEAARDVLDGVTVVTPMQTSRWLSASARGEVHLKLENLQRTGSFKTRGAYLRISRLSAAERANGVVAASAGNHAQGVALSASLLGIKSTVFMPEGAPIPKVRATEAYGADIVFHGQYLDQALIAARAFADETGAVLIHPFDHTDIVTGQGTCGIEIVEQVPDVKTVVVPTGGGGLLAGIAIAVKSLKPDVRVVGVQAAGAAAYPKSLADGHPVAFEHMRTIADGIAVGCPGQSRSTPCSSTSTTSSRSPRTRCRGPCCRSPSVRSRSWSRPARPGWRPCSTTRPASRRRPSWCSAVATSTRCSSAR